MDWRVGTHIGCGKRADLQPLPVENRLVLVALRGVVFAAHRFSNPVELY